jgi:hypothetical protein
MRTLLLKTQDGQVHRGVAILHCLLAMSLNINPDTIVACGFVAQSGDIWDNRQPHS